MWKLKYMLHVLKEDRGIGVVEMNSGNSSTNENFKEMLKTLYFQ